MWKSLRSVDSLILILARFVPWFPLPGIGKGLLLLHGNGILILAYVVPGYFPHCSYNFWMVSCIVLQLRWLHISRKESSETMLLNGLVLTSTIYI